MFRQFSQNERIWADREEAARDLIPKLAQYKGQNTLVLFLPRGGVYMGKMIAYGIEDELDFVLVRSLYR